MPIFDMTYETMPREELDGIIADTLEEAKRLNQTVVLHEIGYPNF